MVYNVEAEAAAAGCVKSEEERAHKKNVSHNCLKLVLLCGGFNYVGKNG